MSNSNIILVPTDFTAVDENATKNTRSLDKNILGEIHLFHVIGNEKERPDAEKKLADIAAKVTAESGVSCKWSVKEGSIFEDIGQAAKEVGAKLIFMGTHGAKGTQKIFGSYALKVITKSETPFIVTHLKPMREGYKKVLIPIDLSKESKQILFGVMEIVKYFNSEVVLFVKTEKDEFFARQVANNVSFAKSTLAQNGIKYEVQMGEGGKGFAKEVIKAATAIDADLIAILNLKDHTVDLLGGSFEQDVIANDAQIPVMVMNHLNSLVTGDFKGFFR